MENNFGNLLQWGIFFLGIIYFLTDVIRTFKRENFQCLKNEMIFQISILGAISVFLLLLFIYYVYCIQYSSLPEKYILLSFGYMALIFPASGYCYFESLVNENEYKLVMEQKKLSPEYSTWKKKKKVFVYMEFAMIVIVLVSIIGLQ